MKTIMIIGAGVVGQASGKGFIKKGHKVIFVDKNEQTVQNLKNQGYNAYTASELENNQINENVEITMFCVPTPSDIHGNVNLDFINAALITYGGWMKINAVNQKISLPNHLIVVRSTVPPKTTRTLLIPILEKYSGLKAGIDFKVCMQPEFLRAVSSEDDFLNPRLTVIGQMDSNSGNILEQVYVDFNKPIIKVDLDTAEFIKYISNCFNATKISFSNEMWLLGQKLGLDANKALQIVVGACQGYWDPKYGTIGGQPFGGTCLPKDSSGLIAYARDNGIELPLLSAVVDVNLALNRLASEGHAAQATIAAPRFKDRPVMESDLQVVKNKSLVSYQKKKYS